MITYNDFVNAATSDKKTTDFVLSTISSYKSSDTFKDAMDFEAYYYGENPTIMRYEKVIYDLQGMAHQDMWTANHKIASNFFQLVVDQEVNYLLSNGVTFNETSTKEKLGATFDQKIAQMLKYASIQGVSFGLWDGTGIRPFKRTEFIPLYDEETGALQAGIRFWQIASNKPLRATLFEPDGYTEYTWNDSKPEIMQNKRSYLLKVRSSAATGTETYGGENYSSLPIIPMNYNELQKSEMCGKRNTVDALDLLMSGMVNNCDEGALIYWVLKNVGGMDAIDDLEFIKRIKTLGVFHIDGGDDVDAEPHTIDAPVTGNIESIDVVKKSLYADFQCFDTSEVTAANQSATAIKAAYTPLDLKSDRNEACVTEFILKLLGLLEIDDNPTYTRNKITNVQEEVQSVLMAANYVSSEYVTKKILTLFGDIDQVESVMDEMTRSDAGRFELEDVEENV